MEICDDIYTTSNKVRLFCFFAIFPIDISVLGIFSLICLVCLATSEFNFNDAKQKQCKTPLIIKELHISKYEPCFSPSLYF